MRKEEELVAIMENIFGFFDSLKEEIAREFGEFWIANQNLNRLVSDIQNGDTIKGFDIEEGLDMELLVDWEELDLEPGEEEENMIK